MNLKLTRFSLKDFLLVNLKNNLTYKHNLIYLARFWLKGFHTEHIALFDLKNNDHKKYLNDTCRYKITLGTNVHVWPILHDKLFFDSFMHDKLPVVPMLFFLKNGDYNKINKDFDRTSFLNQIDEGLSFVIKPIQGGMGEGLYFIKSENGQLRINGKSTNLKEIEDLLNMLEYHGCYPFVKQHPTLSEIYDQTTNTLRVTSYITNSGKPKIFGAILRAGTKDSIPVDNFSQGGLSLFIDQDEGVTISAFTRGRRGEKIMVECHPDSNKKLVGIVIPFWQEIKSSIIEFHNQFPSFDLVGWDVIPGEDKFYIIEGNHNPSLRSTLIHKNLEDDPDFKEFFKKRGIIS